LKELVKSSLQSALVVNDVEINLIVTSELLNSYGVSSDTAEDGLTALDLLNSGKTYELIFMDNKMPGLSGVETVRKARELGYSGKIIMLSGDDLSDETQANEDFDGFLLNPIDANRLEELLSGLFSNLQFASSTCATEQTAPPSPDERLMRAFTRDANSVLADLAELKATGKLTEATAKFHSIKTALANAGFAAEARTALDLEQAGLRGDFAYITANLDCFVEALKALIPDAQDDTQESSQENTQEPLTDGVLAKLQAIKDACESYDLRGADSSFADLLDDSELASSTRAFVEEMRDLVRYNCDFDEAAEKLQAKIQAKIQK